MRRAQCLIAILGIAVAGLAAERVPGEQWMSYVDPTEAGFDADLLEAAHRTWQDLPSSAFMVVADGAVVAGWGDVSRRFMCHSVRKSFLSALYGVYWDREEIELNKTLADLGIDDLDDGLLEAEKKARILDLLKARSGVFHPAAYAGRTDSQPRGSQGPGRYFAYNNWDFNTLVTILEQETGDGVFEAFDRYFGRPLEMEDWRVTDGYYHYERDTSIHPAYPFRMSARDAARFGLLFARAGLWGDTRILSRDWVNRSTAMYSIDSDIIGYGMLWWVLREERFKRHGMFAALGVGNQMIAVLPDIDVVIVNRADTYRGEETPRPELLDLVESVLEARTGRPVSDPNLAPIEIPSPDPRLAPVAADRLAGFTGEWIFPPPPLGLPQLTTVSLTEDVGALVAYSEVSGTFRQYLQSDGTLLEEDSLVVYHPIRDADGALTGIADADTIARAAVVAAVAGESARAAELLDRVVSASGPNLDIARAIVAFLGGHRDQAETALGDLAAGSGDGRVKVRIDAVGDSLLQTGRTDAAIEVFELNTRLFPEAYSTWRNLGEALMTAGDTAGAVRSFRTAGQLEPGQPDAAPAP
jgi:CubicO group peptidase (beta-lactamase class C family)